MQRSKDLTFIGFSVKARKIVYGISLIADYRKRIYLLILCRSASENTKKTVMDFARYNNIKTLVTQDILLEEIVNKPNCKTIGLTDKNLAAAVLENISGYLKACSGGSNHECGK